MTARTLLVALLGTLTGAARLEAAAPVPAGKPVDGPPVVVQLAPLGQLVDDVKAMARAVAGDQVADQITRAINQKLGEKGFAGIDTKKPLAAYAYLPEKLGIAGKQPNEINPAEMLRGYKGVLVIPATTPDEFKDLLARLTNGKVALTPIDGKDGLFKMDDPNTPAPFPVRVRFHADHAYVGLNLSDDEMDAKSLIAPETLIDPKEKAQVVLRAFPDRYPPGLMKEAMDAVDGMIAQMKGQFGGQEQPTWTAIALNPYVKMVRRYADQLMKESTEVGYKLSFDRATAEAAWEFVVIPKKGTSLAADIAARKPSTNKFAGLLTSETAAGVTLEYPLFAEEIKEIFTGLIEKGREQAKEKAPPPAQPVIDEWLQGLARTVKTGELDIAVAVNGPDKDGHFTAVAAVAFEDAGKLEKAIKAAEKDFPKEMKDAIRFDAEKARAVNIHKVTPPQAPDLATAEKVLGSTVIYVAFGEHGIYAAVGTNALDAIKKALAAKPGEAKPLDVVVNPKRLQQLVAAGGEQQAGKFAAQILGTDDKRVSAVSVSVEGTDALRVRFAVNLKLLPRALLGARMRGGPGGPAAPVPVID